MPESSDKACHSTWRVAPANRRRNRLGHMQFGYAESNKWYAARSEPSQFVLLAIFFTFKQHLFDRLSFRILFPRTNGQPQIA